MANTTNLEQAGLKTTQPRLKVLNVLETSEIRHMTAEDVYKQLIQSEQEVGACNGLPHPDPIRNRWPLLGGLKTLLV